jgi:hypothetical protein
MQLKIRIVDAKFLQFTYEGHILVLVPTGGDLLYVIHFEPPRGRLKDDYRMT